MYCDYFHGGISEEFHFKCNELLAIEHALNQIINIFKYFTKNKYIILYY